MTATAALNGAAREELGAAMSRLMSRHPSRQAAGPVAVELVEAEVLRPGRPGLLDVLARVEGRLAHAVLGVCRPGELPPAGAGADELALGRFEDDQGPGVLVDALRDRQLAGLVLAAVLGGTAHPGGMIPVRADDVAVQLAFGGTATLIVFPWVTEAPHRGVELLVGLDEAGFNHLAAPLARWRRGGRDLGVVQELPAGASRGWALAAASLRDLLAAGVAPEEAGGDFAPEAHSLGTMTARMHLALDRAFGRRSVDVTASANQLVRTAEACGPPGWTTWAGAEAARSLSAGELLTTAVRSNGDFNLGRSARTDHGWVVADFLEGPWGSAEALFRSPLADVGDLLWSLDQVAAREAAERDRRGPRAHGELAGSWAQRNRHALLDGYLATPGIGELVPEDRALIGQMTTMYELSRRLSAA
jgi:maltokinase